MEQSRKLRRIGETRTWPDSLWGEVIYRFTCPYCGALPGKHCITKTGNNTTHHMGRLEVASEAIVDAMDAGKDPKRVGVCQTDTPTPEEKDSMNAAQALDMLWKAKVALWQHFGHERPLTYNIVNKLDSRWRDYGGGGEIGWWNDDSEWQDALDEAGGDPYDAEVMYSGDVYGTSVWRTETHTMAVLNDGCGNRDAYVFTNALKV